LNTGADVNGKDEHDGSFPLHKTATIGSRGNDVVELLSGKGADVNSCGENGKTLLFYVVLGDDSSTVEALIEGGASLNATGTHEGYTALHVSARNGTSACESIISLLLSQGASPTAQTLQK
jgi:ankyrin repeat protein